MISFESNIGLAHKFVLSHFRCKEPVEDTEEYSVACESLFNACKNYKSELGAFSTFAYKCIKNAFINSNKKNKIQIKNINNFDKIIDYRNGNRTDINEETKMILLILNGLDKAMLIDRYLNGMKLREIAVKHNVTKMRVSQRIKRAIKKIRSEIENRKQK